MEQGRVTIAKAGIHARLNARCSVLAAANPVYGRYDQYKTPMENIGLQDSLLSRFDCLFIMLDIAEPEADRKISDHVVRMHRYRAAHEQEGEALPMGLGVDMLSTTNPNEVEDDEAETPIYEKYDALLHGSLRNKKDKIVSMKFMKKYIHIAKSIKPVLSREASETIAEEYSRLRSQDTEHSDMARTQPVTPRALETLIRLATAHAKSRLSKTIEEQDAEVAIQLVQFAYFKKVLDRKGKKRGGEESDDEEEDNVEREETPSKRRRRPSGDGAGAAEEAPSKKARVAEQAEEEPSSSSAVNISEARLKHFMALLHRCISDRGNAQELELHVLRAFFDKHEKEAPFSDAEIDACIEKMSGDNKLMRSEDTIYVI